MDVYKLIRDTIIICRKGICLLETQFFDKMEIGFNIVVDRDSESKRDSMKKISELMKSFFKDKDYGAINYYWIVCMAVSPDYGKFASVSRPMFKETYHFLRLDRTREELKGVYTCGFNFDADEFKLLISSTDEEAERIIARKVVDSLSYLDRLSKKAAAFDKERFKSDMIQLFKDNNLI